MYVGMSEVQPGERNDLHELAPRGGPRQAGVGLPGTASRG